MAQPYPGRVTRLGKRPRRGDTIASMTPHPLELYRVSGTHHEVGIQMGELGAEQIRRGIETFDGQLPEGRTRAEQLRLAQEYRDVTAPSLPWLIDELDGCAEGAGVDTLEFFATTVEELWYTPYPKRTQGRCSDVVAGPAATADGHLWVGHNNDLARTAEEDIVAIEWRVPGEPVVFSLGIGPWISVGWNDAGLSLTGNELSPTDDRVGVSRLLMVREQLTARSIDEAVTMALRPDRASSYNTVFAHRDGRVVNVEGSAGDAETWGLDEHGALAHTNHYVHPRMLSYEGDPEYAVSSSVRFERACALLADAAPGAIDAAWLRAAISDHATSPAICRHKGDSARSHTVFWCIADVTAGDIRYGAGPPCDSVEQRYAFS